MNTTERIVLHCVKCGAQNPIVAETCHKCGHQLRPPQEAEAENEAHAPASRGNVRRVCGWSLVLAGLVMLAGAAANLLTGREIIPYNFFSASKPVGMISTAALGLVFSIAGIGILRKAARGAGPVRT